MPGSATASVSTADARSPARADDALSAWERASYAAVRAAMATALALLGLTNVYRFARAFGTLEWAINYKRRRRFARVLARVFPEGLPRRSARGWCREYFMRSRCDRLFGLILGCLPRERAVSLFSIDGRERLDRALAGGRGAYVALAHLGAHHIGAVLMCLMGYKVAGVRDGHESALRRYVQQRYRRKFPEFAAVRMFFTDVYPRKVYRCLEEGYVLGSAMDVSRPRHPNQKTETVTIFGQRRAFLTGPLRIALRSRVTVFQGFVLPDGGFRYRLVLEGPLVEGDASGDEESAVHTAMAAYAANVEARVRRDPAQISRV